MKKEEINAFIEEMEAIGDIWTTEEVERTYGDKTLEEALQDRKNDLGMFFDAIGSVIRNSK